MGIDTRDSLLILSYLELSKRSAQHSTHFAFLCLLARLELNLHLARLKLQGLQPASAVLEPVVRS